MSPALELVEGVYVHPTPLGAWSAVTSRERDEQTETVRRLLQLTATPLLSAEGARQWTGLDDETDAIAVIWHMQQAGRLEGREHPAHPPSAALEEVLPELLASLSSRGQALLADGQGFCLSAVGYDRTVAAELSAISADLASLHHRHERTIADVVGPRSASWGLVDGVGSSQLGFWPLHVGDQRFVLVAAGLPRLNHPRFTELVWALTIRYGDPSPAARDRPVDAAT